LNLSQLAFACYVYRRRKGDADYVALRADIGYAPDLADRESALTMLKWLNAWRCRLPGAGRDLAVKELREWYAGWGRELPEPKRTLLELSDAEMESAADAYADLAQRRASRGRAFQATAASKVLFFVRPEALPPWDEAIRKRLTGGAPLDGGRDSYLSFLIHSRRELQELAKSCEESGCMVEDVPALVGGPESTLAKLVDEYHWVTITRECAPPDKERLYHWLLWMMPRSTRSESIAKLLRVSRKGRTPSVHEHALWELREISKT
jgi:hypothetical protein